MQSTTNVGAALLVPIWDELWLIKTVWKALISQEFIFLFYNAFAT